MRQPRMHLAHSNEQTKRMHFRFVFTWENSSFKLCTHRKHILLYYQQRRRRLLLRTTHEWVIGWLTKCTHQYLVVINQNAINMCVSFGRLFVNIFYAESTRRNYIDRIDDIRSPNFQICIRHGAHVRHGIAIVSNTRTHGHICLVLFRKWEFYWFFFSFRHDIVVLISTFFSDFVVVSFRMFFWFRSNSYRNYSLSTHTIQMEKKKKKTHNFRQSLISSSTGRQNVDDDEGEKQNCKIRRPWNWFSERSNQNQRWRSNEFSYDVIEAVAVTSLPNHNKIQLYS